MTFWFRRRYQPIGAAMGGLRPIFTALLQTTLTPERAAGSPTPNFTRATTAYVLGYGPSAVIADGPVLLAVASGEARFMGARRVSQGVWSAVDANGVALTTTNGASALCCDAFGPFGYRPEGARTNLCLQSNAFTTTWTASGTPAATQNVTGPDGVANSAWTLTDNAAGTIENVLQAITLTAATYTASVFVKKTVGAQASYPRLVVYDGVSLVAVCTIDTSNGVATVWTAATGFTVTTSSARCRSFNADYWRVELTFLATAASWNFYIDPAGTTNATQSTGAGDVAAQGSAAFYGAQVELGSFASSYIPTTTVAVTRNADIDQYVSASNLSASAMTLALDWTPQSASMGTVFLFGTYVDASNYTAILHDGTNIIARKRIAGANHDATKALAYTAGTTYRIVARFDGTNGCDVWVDGVKGTNDSTTTASQIGTNFQIGADGNSLQQAFSAIRRFSVYGASLSDGRAAAL